MSKSSLKRTRNSLRTADVTCAICADYFSVPIIKCSCEHNLCQNCYNKLSNRICPFCRAVYPQPPSRDYALEERLKSFPAKCPFAEYGCTAHPTLATLQRHRAACKFNKTTKCPLLNKFSAYVTPCRWESDFDLLCAHLQSEPHKLSVEEAPNKVTLKLVLGSTLNIIRGAVYFEKLYRLKDFTVLVLFVKIFVGYQLAVYPLLFKKPTTVTCKFGKAANAFHQKKRTLGLSDPTQYGALFALSREDLITYDSNASFSVKISFT